MELVHAYFNSTYDAMYQRVLQYVIMKCSDISYVEDIVQDTFAEFYKLLCKKGQEYIRNNEAIIMQIAKTKVYKYYSLKRKLKNILPLTNKKEEDIETVDLDTLEIEQRYINSYTVTEIWRIIKKMPKDVQKIFVLHYYLDKKIVDIAIELRLTQSNVKHKLYRTIEKIREIYKKEGEIL